MQTVIEQAGGLEAFLHEAAHNFEVVSNIKNKKKKKLAVYVLFKAYPMVPLSCRSNLAGRWAYRIKNLQHLVEKDDIRVSDSFFNVENSCPYRAERMQLHERVPR